MNWHKNSFDTQDGSEIESFWGHKNPFDNHIGGPNNAAITRVFSREDSGALVTLLDIMLTAQNFFAIGRNLNALSELTKNDFRPDVALDHRIRCADQLLSIMTECETIELQVTAELMRQHAKILKDSSKSISPSGFGSMISTISNCMVAEMESLIFVRIPRSKKELFEQKTPVFEQSVADAFPSAIDDISEAAKCLAFSRATATVFHLMRAMECSAVKAFAKAQSVAINPTDTWGQIIGKIKQKNPPVTDYFTWEAIGLLESVKNAWRNPTMHPASKYTEEEAKTIFESVKGFMIHLAKNIKE